MNDNIKLAAGAAAVATGTFVYARNVLRTKRQTKALKAASVEWNDYVRMYNEQTGASVTVHRDFVNLTAVLDCLTK